MFRAKNDELANFRQELHNKVIAERDNTEQIIKERDLLHDENAKIKSQLTEKVQLLEKNNSLVKSNEATLNALKKTHQTVEETSEERLKELNSVKLHLEAACKEKEHLESEKRKIIANNETELDKVLYSFNS